MQCHRRRRPPPTTVFKLSLHKSNMTSWPSNVRHFLVVKEYIFILKRNSVTENVQLTLESYLRLAKFLLLSREEYWSFKNTIFDIRWVYLSMEEWVQTTRASSQITFFKYLLTVYRHLDLSQKQNKKNQIDWLFFRGSFDGYILWNFKQNSSRIPSYPSYSVHFLSSFSFLSLFWMLFNSKFLLLLSWINVSIWLIELT